MGNELRCELLFAEGVGGDPCDALEIPRVDEGRMRDMI